MVGVMGVVLIDWSMDGDDCKCGAVVVAPWCGGVSDASRLPASPPLIVDVLLLYRSFEATNCKYGSNPSL